MAHLRPRASYGALRCSRAWALPLEVCASTQRGDCRTALEQLTAPLRAGAAAEREEEEPQGSPEG